MSSDSLRPYLRSIGSAALAALLVCAAACGKKGDPAPAPRTLPQTTSDLKVRQRGFEVVLEMAHPKTTAAGLALPGLDELVVYELQRPAIAPIVATTPAPTPAPTPAAVAPALTAPGRPEFVAGAKPTLRIGGSELASAISGDRITVRFRLPEPLPSPAPQRVYAIRTHALGGESSDLSNLVVLLPRDVPEAPVDFRVTPKKGGIETAWKAGAATLAGYNVYRRAADQTGYGPPIAGLDASGTSSLDKTAAYGQRYIYAVTAVAAHDPLVESALSAEREVVYDDRFAPAPPAGLTALPATGAVRLVWDAVAEPDVAGYVVERAEPGSEFHRVNAEPVAATELTDSGLGSGFTFRYRVGAVDRSGNLGAFSAAVEARVP